MTCKQKKQMAIIRLYGDITDWYNNAADLTKRLQVVDSKADHIDMHIHSYGGSVIEGTAIFNAILNNPIPVYCYVDGIAASMAGIVIMAGSKVYMSENAYIMLHAPAGGCDGRGTAEDHLKIAETLKKMQTNFVKAVVSRTGQSEQTVTDWLKSETWFTAEEALNAGLIDGIVDRVAEGVKVFPKAEISLMGEQSVYSLYSAYLTEKTTKNQNFMNKKELIDRFGLTGVTENSTDAEIYAAIDAKLQAEREARTEAENALNSYLEAEIKAVLDSVKDKITAEQRTQFEAIGKKVGMEALRAAISPYRQKVTFSAMIDAAAGHGGQPQKSWDDYQKENPLALDRMRKDDPEQFKALYRAKYGVEPNI